jgi:hypothetical protein
MVHGAGQGGASGSTFKCLRTHALIDATFVEYDLDALEAPTAAAGI